MGTRMNWRGCGVNGEECVDGPRGYKVKRREMRRRERKRKEESEVDFRLRMDLSTAQRTWKGYVI